MNTSRLIAGLGIALTGSIAIAGFAPKANAQANDPFFQAVPGVRLCNTIVNLSNANPNNLQLRLAARECFFLEYQRGLCLQNAIAQFPPRPEATNECWRIYINLTPRIRAVGSQLSR